MKTSHTLAVKVVTSAALLLGMTACSGTPAREAADEGWQPASVCPLNSGFLWSEPDRECLIKEQQQWKTGYIT